jgi:serine/threonine protein kinase
MIGSGTVFGPYRVIEKIGAGGMGDVYRALDTRLEREVALKLIGDSFLVSEPSPSPAGTPHSRVHLLSHERFLREARAAANLNLPTSAPSTTSANRKGSPISSWSCCAGKH